MIRTTAVASTNTSGITGHAPVVESDWRAQLPVLHAGGVTLREVELSDAPSLHAMLTTEEVSRFISPPPSTVEGFERFIQWTHRERASGAYVCFAVVPDGCDRAVGLFQIRQLGSSFDTAEWGFAIGRAFWGTGAFAASAPIVVDFAIDTLQVRRLEARSAVQNGRGNGALQKIGALREAVLRKAFLKEGTYHDQVLWSITADEWRISRRMKEVRVH